MVEMNETTQKAVMQRLASASGHMRGIERMVKEDVYCFDTIRQIEAVRAALSKVSVIILDSHMRSCMAAAIHGDDTDERERMLQEVISIFEVSPKL